MKTYWVRVRIQPNDYYGRWIPTGMANLDDAKEYIDIYYRPSGFIVEWLLA